MVTRVSLLGLDLGGRDVVVLLPVVVQGFVQVDPGFLFDVPEVEAAVCDAGDSDFWPRARWPRHWIDSR